MCLSPALRLQARTTVSSSFYIGAGVELRSLCPHDKLHNNWVTSVTPCHWCDLKSLLYKSRVTHKDKADIKSNFRNVVTFWSMKDSQVWGCQQVTVTLFVTALEAVRTESKPVTMRAGCFSTLFFNHAASPCFQVLLCIPKVLRSTTLLYFGDISMFKMLKAELG